MKRLILTFISAVMGQDSFNASKIFGGTPVGHPTILPWVVDITTPLSEPGLIGKCAGVLLDYTSLITAAHCSQNIPNLSDVLVRAHISDLSVPPRQYQNEVRFEVVSIQIHPRFDSQTLMNDLAVWYVRPMQGKSYMHLTFPILNKIPDSNYNNYFLSSAGFGLWESGQVSDLKLRTYLPVVSREACMQQYRRETWIGSGAAICAGQHIVGAPSTCSGDSGGPLFFEFPTKTVVVGITSFTNSGCGQGMSVYASIYAALPWIEHHQIASRKFRYTEQPSISTIFKLINSTSVQSSGLSRPLVDRFLIGLYLFTSLPL